MGTLESSYLQGEYWVFEVEALIREGIALLRADADDRSGAVMLGEAMRRLLEKRWARESEQRRTYGWFARFLRESERERHHWDLESMAQGALYHYGWADMVKAAAQGARDGDLTAARVVVTVKVDPDA